MIIKSSKKIIILEGIYSTFLSFLWDEKGKRWVVFLKTDNWRQNINFDRPELDDYMLTDYVSFSNDELGSFASKLREGIAKRDSSSRLRGVFVINYLTNIPQFKMEIEYVPKDSDEYYSYGWRIYIESLFEAFAVKNRLAFVYKDLGENELAAQEFRQYLKENITEESKRNFFERLGYEVFRLKVSHNQLFDKCKDDRAESEYLYENGGMRHERNCLVLLEDLQTLADICQEKANEFARDI